MTHPYPSQLDLQHRLRRACLDEDSKPLVFMVGSGASAGLLPSTAEMVEYFRRSIAADPDDESDFNSVVGSTDPQHQYQTAAKFLIERAGLPHLNRVVRLAVLRARSPQIPPATARTYTRDEAILRSLEEDFSGWALPQGTAAIAKILAHIPPEVRGPILTTNFDPLLEVGLRAAGIEPFSIVADGDGAVTVPEGVSTVIPVAHLHGFWRIGDTLHTAAQLNTPRPRLLGSLRQILSNSTCVVIGYGGWDDVLTSSILEIVQEGSQRELEVLWACHGTEASMGVISGVSLPGRIQAFTSVDANSLLVNVQNAIISRLRTSTALPPLRRPEVVISGMTSIDRGFLNLQRSRSRDERIALSFFDGREPSWIDVTTDRVAKLVTARRLVADFENDETNTLCTLLEGPTGEGKSTALRQVAVAIAESGNDYVYWAEPGARISVPQIRSIAITSAKHYLFFDDADLSVGVISEVIALLKSEQRSDVRLVLAARDTDWDRATRAVLHRIGRSDIEARVVSGLSREDARLIVASWAKFGASGLGKLAQKSSTEDRVDVLYQESLDAGESAMLGALLATRYGGEFRDHIRNLLRRLHRVRLPGDQTLLDAYMTICLPPQIDMGPITIKYLAWAMGLTEKETQVLVIDRLGREAAAQKHGDIVLARHRRIAEVTLDLAPEFGLSASAVLSNYVASVVANVRGLQWGADILDVAFCGQRIVKEDLAIVAVDAAVRADPTQLRLRASQMQTYWRFERLAEAGRLAAGAWDDIDGLNDVRVALRGYFCDWARIQGLQGDWRGSAALNACALLDLPIGDSLQPDVAARGLSGLAISLENIDSNDPVRMVAWRGVLAEEATDLGRREEVRLQAERTLGRAVHDGYIAENSVENRRKAVGDAIRFSMNLSGLAPTRTYRRIADKIQQLCALIESS
ncbi:MAG: SIR2 family protein [Jatrophihabitantaceae bacterium]